MTSFWLFVVVVLLALVIAGLWRILAGPSRADRLLATQLFGTIGVAVLCALAAYTNRPLLIDVALVFAFLAAVTASAFAYVSNVARAERSAPAHTRRADRASPP